MTFKVKGGIQIGANSAVDADALFESIEASVSIRPTLLLDFARSKTIDSRISFVRASNASYVDSDGLIRYVGNNQPRIEYNPVTGECDGLLIESSRANEQRNSEGFANNTHWSKTNLRVAENVAVAPDGSFTATRVFDNVEVTNSFHSLSGTGVTITPSTTVTQSVFAKAGELTRIGLYPITGSNGVVFDLNTGTSAIPDTGVTSTIQQYANGWYRCTATITSNATATTAFPSMYTLAPTGTNYTGNNNTLFVWGHQFDNAQFASSYIPSIPTFVSRASNGTFYDASGTLQTATTDVARFNCTPSNLSIAPKLLIEQASTNVLTYSEQLDHVNWQKGGDITVTANAIASPTGELTAENITKAAGSSWTFVRQGFAGIVANTTYTISCFVKKNNYRYVGLRAAGSTLPSGVGGDRHATFDFDTETFIASTPVDYKTGFDRLANGWYRIYATVNLTVASTSAGWQLGLAIPNINAQEIWDSGSTGAVSVYAWGMQAETGFLTSYIPTIASATRAADVHTVALAQRQSDEVSMPITSTKLTTSEGTILLEARVDGNASDNQYLFDLGNGTTNALSAIRAIANTIQFVQFTSGVSQGTINLKSTYAANTPFKVAVSYSNTGWNGSADGGNTTATFGVGGAGVAPYGTITIGSGFFGAGVVRRMLVKSASYYSNKISNTELQVLTSS